MTVRDVEFTISPDVITDLLRIWHILESSSTDVGTFSAIAATSPLATGTPDAAVNTSSTSLVESSSARDADQSKAGDTDLEA